LHFFLSRCSPLRDLHSFPTRRSSDLGPDEALGARERGRMMSERVLVLDGRTIEALACVRSLGRAGYWVAVGGKLRWPLASWSRYFRAGFHYPKETLAGFAALRTWAHRNEVRVVLPLTEATSLLCNAVRSAWVALGVIGGCAQDSVLLCAFEYAESLRRAAAC